MQEWEYRWMLRTRGAKAPIRGAQAKPWNTELDWLNTWGEEGWELVAVVPRSGQGSDAWAGFTNEELWVFKRPK